MPIGIVSDDEFLSELDSLSSSRKESHPSTPLVSIVDKPTRGRSDGDVNVPDSLRQIIGETAVIDGRQDALQLASMFGISASSVSAYTNGSTSTKSYDTPSKSILQHINKSRQRSIKKASHVLKSALSAITQEKLDYTDARDLSGIAKDMSVIIKNLEPQAEAKVDGTSTPQFVIYAPSFKDERSFEVITVNE
jgi:transcriptional regulator with XRE-family HTH domain